jgi:hypothetical protein
MAAWAEIMASLVLDTSKAKADAEKSLKSVDAKGAGQQAGTQFAAGAKPEIEGGLKGVDGKGAGAAVGTQFAAGAKPEVEKGLKGVDGAAAGKSVGAEFSGAAKTEIEGGLKAVDGSGAGKAIGTSVASSAKPEIEKGLGSVNAEKAGKNVGTSFTNGLKGPISAITGLLGPVLAIGGGVALFKGIIDQGGAAAKAGKVVADAIKTTGAAAGVSAQQIEEMAGAQARATGIDKSAIEQSDALLLRYKNIKNAAGEGNDVFNQTSKAALDMTAALNKGQVTEEGLTNTTKLLGKALEDPTKAAATLRRSGVDLTAQQQASIKTMMAQNDTLGAQKVVLDAVNSSYGGTAAATASGSAKMKVAVNEFEAALGKQLIPAIGQLLKLVTLLLDQFAVVAEWFNKGGTAASILKDALIGLTVAITAYVVAVKVVETATKAWAVIQAIMNAELVANPIGLIVAAIALLVLGLIEAYKHSQLFRDIVADTWAIVRAVAVPAARALGDAVGWLKDGLLALLNPMAILRDAWDGLSAVFRVSAAAITAALTAVGDHAPILALIVKANFALIRAEVTAVVAVFHALLDVLVWLEPLWRAIWTVLQDVVKLDIALIVVQVRMLVSVFQDMWAVLAALAPVWRAIWSGLELVVRAELGLIVTVMKATWELITGLFDIARNVWMLRWGDAWHGITQLVRTETAAMTAVLRAAFGVWQAVTQAGTGVISAAWSVAWSRILSVTKSSVGGVTSLINGLISVVREIPRAFEAAVSGVVGALQRMVGAVAGPVDAITSKLGSIGKVFNSISGAVGLAAKIPGLAKGGLVSAVVPALAEGGRVTAGTTETADDVLIRVSRDETVVSAAHSRILAPYFAALGIPGYVMGGVPLPGFQLGGLVNAVESAVGKTTSAAVNAADSAVGATKSATDAVASEFGDIASQIIHVAGVALDVGKIAMGLMMGDTAEIERAFGNFVGDHHPQLDPNSMLDQIFVATPKKIADDLTGWLKDNGGSATGSTILSYAMTFANKVPYVWGGAQPSGWDCCIIGSMEIQTPAGPRQIRDITPGDLVYSWDDGALKVSRVERRSDPRRQMTYRLRTQHREITASGNHPLMVIRRTGQPAQERAGDRECSVKDCHEPATSRTVCARHYTAFWRAGKLDSLPGPVRGRRAAGWEFAWTELDQLHRDDLVIILRDLPDDAPPPADKWLANPDYLWLLGAMFGDGWLSRARVGPCDLSMFGEQAEQAKVILARLTPNKVTAIPIRPAGGGGGVRWYDRELAAALLRDGMGDYSRDRTLPPALWTLPHKLIQAFLDGYTAADGHTMTRPSDPGLSYSAVNETLIRQVRDLHMILGHNVTRVRRQAQNDKPKYIKGKLVKSVNPLWCFQAYETGAKQLNHGGRLRTNQAAASLLPADSHFTAERVLAVDQIGEDDTYDITVEGTHTYVAEGILNHNSGFVSWIYNHFRLLSGRLVADALQSWGTPTPGPIPGGMIFFGRPAHHVGFAIDNAKYLSALGHKYGTIVSGSSGNSGYAIPPKGFADVNGAGAGTSAPGTYMNAKGVSQWAPLVGRALAMLGLSLSLAPQVLHQMQTESGGQPNVVNNWDCVTFDYVILTRRGWLCHDQVQAGDETIGYNPETGRSEWTRISRVMHYPAAEVWRIGNRHWHADVTPNHRWWSDTLTRVQPASETCPECGWTPRGRKSPARGVQVHRAKIHGITTTRAPLDTLRGEFVRTEDLHAAHRLRLAAPADTSGIPGLSAGDVRVIAWLQGDGTITPYRLKPQVCPECGWLPGTGRKSSRGPVTQPANSVAVHRALKHQVRKDTAAGELAGWDGAVWQSKPAQIVKIRALLGGVEHTETTRQRPGNTMLAHAFLLRRAYVTDLIKRSRVMETGPEAFVLALSPDQRAAWLDSMIDAEGHRQPVTAETSRRGASGEFVRIAQTDGPLADAIKLAVYLEGYRPTWSRLTRRSGKHKPAGMVGIARPHIAPSMFGPHEVLGRQPVWCVTTELGTWTTRGGDLLPLLTGNSNAKKGTPSQGLLTPSGDHADVPRLPRPRHQLQHPRPPREHRRRDQLRRPPVRPVADARRAGDGLRPRLRPGRPHPRTRRGHRAAVRRALHVRRGRPRVGRPGPARSCRHPRRGHRPGRPRRKHRDLPGPRRGDHPARGFPGGRAGTDRLRGRAGPRRGRAAVRGRRAVEHPVTQPPEPVPPPPPQIEPGRDSLVLADTIELLGGGVASTHPTCPGAVFRLAPAYDTGAPQPSADVVAKLLQGGSRPHGRWADNRTVTLPIIIFAPDRPTLVAARELLAELIDRDQWEARWLRDGAPGPMVLDCFRADPSVPGYSLLEERENFARIEVKFSALPYGRSDIRETIWFPSPVIGGPPPPVYNPWIPIDAYTQIASGAQSASWSLAQRPGGGNYPTSAHWNPLAGANTPVYDRLVPALDISGRQMLIVWIGLGNSNGQWRSGNLTVRVTMYDAGNAWMQFGGTFNLTGTDNWDRPQFTRISMRFPVGTGFDFTTLRRYVFEVPNFTNSAKMGDLYLNCLGAGPAAVPWASPSARGTAYSVQGIGTARTPVSLRFQPPAGSYAQTFPLPGEPQPTPGTPFPFPVPPVDPLDPDAPVMIAPDGTPNAVQLRLWSGAGAGGSMTVNGLAGGGGAGNCGGDDHYPVRPGTTITGLVGAGAAGTQPGNAPPGQASTWGDSSLDGLLTVPGGISARTNDYNGGRTGDLATVTYDDDPDNPGNPLTVIAPVAYRGGGGGYARPAGQPGQGGGGGGGGAGSSGDGQYASAGQPGGIGGPGGGHGGGGNSPYTNGPGSAGGGPSGGGGGAVRVSGTAPQFGNRGAPGKIAVNYLTTTTRMDSLLVHMPPPGTNASWAPMITAGGSWSPPLRPNGGLVFFAVGPQGDGAIPPVYNGTYTVVIGGARWGSGTEGTPRHIYVDIIQYEYERPNPNVLAAAAASIRVELRDLVPNLDPVLLAGYVVLGSVTLPLADLPPDGSVRDQFGITVYSSQAAPPDPIDPATGDLFMEVLLLDTTGQSVLIVDTGSPGSTPRPPGFTNYFIDEPSTLQSTGGILGSNFGRTQARSVTTAVEVASGGPFILEPEGSLILAYSAKVGSPSLGLDYYPRWWFDRADDLLAKTTAGFDDTVPAHGWIGTPTALPPGRA